MQADGSIIIDTKINTDGVETGVSDVQAGLGQMNDTLNGCLVDINQFMADWENGLNGAGAKTNEFKGEIDSLKKQLSDLEGQGLYFGDDAYDEAYLKLQTVEQALKDYKKELTAPTPDANPFGLDTVSGKVTELEIELKNLAAAGKGLGTAEYDEVYRKLAIAKEEAKEYAAELAKTPKMIERENQLLAEKQAKEEALAQKEAQRMAAVEAAAQKQVEQWDAENAKTEYLESIRSNASIADQEIVQLSNDLQLLKQRQAELASAGLGMGYEEFDANATKISEINQRLKEYQATLEPVTETQKEFKDEIKKTSEASTKSNKSIGLSVKTLFKYGLGIRSLFVLMNKLRSAIVEGFKNLAAYSSGTESQLTTLQNSLTQCKNALATAFAPIFNVVAPALNTLINLVTQAATVIAQLMAAITGQSTFIKATKIQEAYADSLEDTGSAAESAGEEAEGSVAAFDKLNIQAEESTSSGSGSGAGAATESVADQFETVSVDNSVTKAIDVIKAKLKDLQQLFSWGFWNGFTNIGSLDSIYTAIQNIKSSLAGIFTDPNVVGAVNYFKARLIYDLGRVAGSVVSIGATIADNLLGGFDEFLQKNSERLKEQIVKIFDIASDISKLVGDWFVNIADIFTVFQSDSAKGITSDIIQIFSDAFFGVTELIGKFIRDVLDTFLEPIEKNKESIKAVLNEVLETVRSLTSEVASLVRDVLDSLNKFYDEHEAEIKLVMSVIAQTIYAAITLIVSAAEGVVKSITEVVKSIRGVLEGLVTFVSGVMTGDWEKAWEGLKTIIKSVANGIIGIIESMINGIVKGLNRISFDIPDWSPIGAGAHFGFSLKEISLPRLASGTVVPPRAGEFAAILGDNKKETEVVSPLSTIKQALLEAIQESGGLGGGDITGHIYLDGKELGKSTVSYIRDEKGRTGKNPVLV